MQVRLWEHRRTGTLRNGNGTKKDFRQKGAWRWHVYGHSWKAGSQKDNHLTPVWAKTKETMKLVIAYSESCADITSSTYTQTIHQCRVTSLKEHVQSLKEHVQLSLNELEITSSGSCSTQLKVIQYLLELWGYYIACLRGRWYLLKLCYPPLDVTDNP